MMPMEKVEILRACCCVTGAGGQTTEQERAMLEKMAKEVGVGKASLEAMIHRGESDPDFCQEQFRVLKSDPFQTMTVLVNAALTDGKLTDEETAILRRLSGNLGMTEEEFRDVLTKALPNRQGD